MTKTQTEFRVERDENGRYYWRLIDENGHDVRFGKGSAPGLRRRKGYAAVDRAVQAGLGAMYKQQQSSMA